MKTLAIVVLLAFSIPAQAQMYKCVDERGKTHYSDKPMPGCKSPATVVAPPPGRAGAPAKSGAAAKAGAKRAAKVAQTEEEKAYFASQCKTLREQEAWLLGPRGSAVQSQAERLGQVRQALSACP